MTEATISPKQLRKFVERILDLKDKQDLAAISIREAYADVKAAGLDKQAVGQLVTFVRKKVRDPEKFEADSAVFELYKKAYEAPSHAHAREEGRRKAAGASPNTTDPKMLGAGPEQVSELIDTNALVETGQTYSTPPNPVPDASTQQDQAAPISPRLGELRPLCRNPNDCAGYGRTTCQSCLRASAALPQAAAVSDFTDAGFARLQRSIGGDAA